MGQETPWLNCKLLSQNQKQSVQMMEMWICWDLQGHCQGLQRCGRKAKTQLETNLARDVENCKKQFFRYVKNKQKRKENIGPAINRRGEFVPASSSPLSSPALLGPQPQEQKSRLLQIQTHQCQWGWAITGAWPLWINGPWHCPGVLRKLTDINPRPFCITFGEVKGEQGISQRTGRIISSPSTSRV